MTSGNLLSSLPGALITIYGAKSDPFVLAFGILAIILPITLSISNLEAENSILKAQINTARWIATAEERFNKIENNINERGKDE